MMRPGRHSFDPERIQHPQNQPQHHLTPRPPGTSGSAVPYYNQQTDWRRSSGDDQPFRHQGEYNHWLANEQQGRPPPPVSSLPPFPPTLPTTSHQPRINNNIAGPSNYHQYQGSVNSPRQFSTWSPNSSRQPSPGTGPSSSVTGKYVPLHLRAPLTGARASPPSPSDLPPSFGYQRENRSPAPAFTIPLPDAEYMELSTPNIFHQDTLHEMAPKLLVLDLNGTLIYRNKGGSNARTSYPRPYLGAFLKYLFRDLTDSDWPMRPWEVFVWSSAQPHNVRAMLESTFDAGHIEGLWNEVKPNGGEGEAAAENEEAAKEDDDDVDGLRTSKVLGVWARDKMGLSKQEYAHKTQTTKDLRKVEAHFGSEDSGFKGFPLHTILLLDDSPLKAVYQPWNQLVLPEYDRDAYQATKRAIQESGDEVEGTECDQFLLAVIGILEATAPLENLPAWIRAGGLKKPDIQEASEEEQEAEWGEDWMVWHGKPDGPAAGEEPTLESLPSREGFQHWFQDPKLVKRWIEKGKAALEEYGIPLDHGIDPAPSVRSSPAPPSRHDRQRDGSAPLLPTGHSVPASRQRGYSPSQPTSPVDAAVDLAQSDTAPDRENVIDKNIEKPGRTAASPTPATVPNANQSRSYITTSSPRRLLPNPIPDRNRPFHVDSWRTFTPIDVAEYLANVSERPSLKKQDRSLLRKASRRILDLNLEPQAVGNDWDRFAPVFQERQKKRGGKGIIMGEEEMPVSTMEQEAAGGSMSRLKARKARSQGQCAEFKASEHTRQLSNAANGGRRLGNRNSDDEWQGSEEDSGDEYPPDFQPPPRAVVPGTIASRTRGAKSQVQSTSISNDEADRSHDHAQDPAFLAHRDPEAEAVPRLPSESRPTKEAAEEEIESPNAQYPLEHDASGLDLPPAFARGTQGPPLTDIEIARFMARAKSNPDEVQKGHVAELAKLGPAHRDRVKVKAAGKPVKNLTSDFNRIIRLRRWIINAEMLRDHNNARTARQRDQFERYQSRGLVWPPPSGPSTKQRSRDPSKPKKPKLSKKEKKEIKQNRKDLPNGSIAAKGGQAGPGAPSTREVGRISNVEAAYESRSSKRSAMDEGENGSAKVQRIE